MNAGNKQEASSSKNSFSTKKELQKVYSYVSNTKKPSLTVTCKKMEKIMQVTEKLSPQVKHYRTCNKQLQYNCLQQLPTLRLWVLGT